MILAFMMVDHTSVPCWMSVLCLQCCSSYLLSNKCANCRTLAKPPLWSSASSSRAQTKSSLLFPELWWGLHESMWCINKHKFGDFFFLHCLPGTWDCSLGVAMGQSGLRTRWEPTVRQCWGISSLETKHRRYRIRTGDEHWPEIGQAQSWEIFWSLRA